MAIADTITSMQTHTSNAYTMIGYGTDLTGINKNLENLSSTIFEAFLEALRTPDTLFTNLPKKSGSGANISLNDTANAPMRIELGATELTQAGTPTPSSPQDIHTISGSNKVVVSNSDNTISQEANIDLGNIEYCKIGNYEDKFIRTSGKNLIPITNQDFTLNSVRYYAKDGMLYLNGTSSGETLNTNTNFKDNFNFTLEAGTYTISHKTDVIGVVINKYADSSQIVGLSSSVASTTFTLNETTKIFIGFYVYQKTFNNFNAEIMISKDSGDYEPYGSNEWYIKKNIGKVVLDGTQNITLATAGSRRFNATYSTLGINNIVNSLTDRYCDHFIYKSGATTWGYYYLYSNWLVIQDSESVIADASALSTWFSNNNTSIYYPLATPTYTQITGTLAEQLEYVYQKLLSYSGTTNISQVNNDLAFNMSVSAIEE